MSGSCRGIPATPAPLTWADWVRESGVGPREVKEMRRVARRLKSDTALYRASFDPVPLEACVGIEVSHDGAEWTRITNVVDGELVVAEVAPRP